MLVRYQAEDKPSTVQPTATRGVSSLLQGSKTVLMPENNERMARRQLHVLTQNHHEANHETHEIEEHTNGHSNGCCGRNGHAEELVSVHANGETYSG